VFSLTVLASIAECHTLDNIKRLTTNDKICIEYLHKEIVFRINRAWPNERIIADASSRLSELEFSNVHVEKIIHTIHSTAIGTKTVINTPPTPTKQKSLLLPELHSNLNDSLPHELKSTTFV
jgi:hypothetical protein